MTPSPLNAKPPISRRRRARQAGYIVLVTAASLFMLIGMLGLASDLGRVYITKTEAQAFADLSAVAAARHLDGKSSGITAAQNEVSNSTNKWDFGTASFTSGIRTVEFSTSQTTGWST